MWIILLDHSASMGQPFEATDFEFKGRIRKVDATTKLEAEKKTVLLQLERLDESVQVVLLGFTSSVHPVYDGKAGDSEKFEMELNRLTADNGTNIAAALEHVADYVETHLELALKPQVLLISDGQSDLKQAKIAAQRCIDAGIRADMLVIDPTDRGVEMAKAITKITNGQWEPVTSSEELKEQTEQSARRFAQETEQAEEILQLADKEFHSVQEQRADKQQVSFTAGYPKCIQRDPKYPMLVYIHLSEIEQEIGKILTQQMVSAGISPAISTSQSAKMIERGKMITVQPNIRNIFSNPPRQEIVWLEDYHKLEFQIHYTGSETGGAICSGFIDIYVDGLIVGQIPVSLTVEADLRVKKEDSLKVETVTLFSRIFASYAHEDEEIVQACKATYKALGIHLYVDRDDLLSGQDWRATLAKLIAKSDLFQLYWSQFSAESTHVADEWELALTVSQTKPVDCHFIRPLCWKHPFPKLPSALQKHHFSFLDLKALNIDYSKKAPGEKAAQIEALPKLPTVFPIIPIEHTASPEMVEHLQAAMGEVVPFLEKMAQLRYYPPPTLLVDEYIVTAVRSQVTVDKKADPTKPPEENIDWALEIIRALALAFHVRDLEPNYMEDEQLQDFYGLSDKLETGDFYHIRKICEYISGPIEAYSMGEDFFQDSDGEVLQGFQERIKEAKADPKKRLWNTADQAARIFAVAESADKRKMEKALGGNPVPELEKSYENLSADWLEKILDRLNSAAFLKAAAKYLKPFYQFFDRDPTTLCRSKDFASYLSSFFHLWLGYIRRAEDHQGDVPIDVGFACTRKAMGSLKQHFPEIVFQTKEEVKSTFRDREEEPSKYVWTISLANYRKAVECLRDLILSIEPSSENHEQRIRTYFLANVPTYGIFAGIHSEEATRRLVELAKRKNWPEGIALPGCPKTLLCINTFEIGKSKLLDMGETAQEAEQRAHWDLVSTLVHEHFHGIVETGIDLEGHSSIASLDAAAWLKGSALNEALAAWFQRHFFRDNPVMFEDISAYIHSGEYPEWPYRGADKIEEIFDDKGLPGVRKLLQNLLEDPDFAQIRFDDLFSK